MVLDRRAFNCDVHGILPLTIEEHHTGCGVTSSLMKAALKSIEHLDHSLHSYDSDKTPALVFGSAFHTLMLEPEKFHEQYSICKESGKDNLTPAQIKHLAGMVDAAEARKISSSILRKDKIVEKTFIAPSPFEGIDIKIRPDIFIPESNLIVDLKTTRDCGQESFYSDSLRFSYDLQAFAYCFVAEKVHKNPVKFLFWAIEKTPPYFMKFYAAGPEFLDRGREKFYRALDLIKDYIANGLPEERVEPL